MTNENTQTRRTVEESALVSTANQENPIQQSQDYSGIPLDLYGTMAAVGLGLGGLGGMILGDKFSDPLEGLSMGVLLGPVVGLGLTALADKVGKYFQDRKQRNNYHNQEVMPIPRT